MEKSDRIITIDGPAGSGKSTLARNLAQALGWSCLDTGALYRAVALVADERGLAPSQASEAGALAASLDIRLYADGPETLVVVGDRDVTGLIRSPGISSLSSRFSAIPEVRGALLGLQRSLGQKGSLVAEGRDMGTVVFPRAGLKFFLTASPETRAGRRQLQLAREGVFVDPLDILSDIEARDYADSNRETARLEPAEGAFHIDSTDRSLFQVETIMIGEAKRAFGL
ncbi:MAG: (d)CMP kinase [Deltaproteobacteria bacterium]|jgi:cytidylate kinase|nr:(d)CMP kinase [Deltaproteobacteria bacterium]